VFQIEKAELHIKIKKKEKVRPDDFINYIERQTKSKKLIPKNKHRGKYSKTKTRLV
jgi:hypothetical protein